MHFLQRNICIDILEATCLLLSNMSAGPIAGTLSHSEKARNLVLYLDINLRNIIYLNIYQCRWKHFQVQRKNTIQSIQQRQTDQMESNLCAFWVWHGLYLFFRAIFRSISTEIENIYWMDGEVRFGSLKQRCPSFSQQTQTVIWKFSWAGSGGD